MSTQPKPFTPQEALEAKQREFPPVVIEAVNNLLSQRIAHGYARIELMALQFGWPRDFTRFVLGAFV